MTCIECFKKDNKVFKIVAKGHSDYDVKGYDIVCSAISTAFYTTVGILEKTKQEYKFVENDKIPLMEITMNYVTELSSLIFDNLLDILKGIEESYAAFIKIKINK